MIFPSLLQPAIQFASLPRSVETRYSLGMSAALMSGWTLLLVWGAVEPIARKGILLLTIIVPVITGLVLATFYGFLNGYIARSGALSV